MRLLVDRHRLPAAFSVLAILLLIAGFGAVRFGNQALESVLVACQRMFFLFGEHLSLLSVLGILLLAALASGGLFALGGFVRDAIRLFLLERKALCGAKSVPGDAAVRLTKGLPYQAWTIGVFRPRIYIASESYDRLSESERQALLAHEKAHVRHHDVLKRTTADALRRLFWFVPTVGEVTEILRFGQEVRADHAALSVAGRRALCGLYVSSFGGGTPAPAPGFAFATPRLAEVLDGRSVKSELSMAKFAVSSVMVGIILFGGWVGIAHEARAEASAPSTCAIIETMAPQSFTPLVGPLELYTPRPADACSGNLSC